MALRKRVSAAAILVAASLLSPQAAAASASSALLALSAVAIPQADGRGAVDLEFSLTSSSLGPTRSASLVVSALRCVSAGCKSLGFTKQSIAAQDLRATSSTLTLRTTWQSQPLILVWRAYGPVSTPSVLVSLGFEKVVMLHATSRDAVATAVLLGRRKACVPWKFGTVARAESQVRIPSEANGGLARKRFDGVPELARRPASC